MFLPREYFIMAFRNPVLCIRLFLMNWRSTCVKSGCPSGNIASWRSRSTLYPIPYSAGARVARTAGVKSQHKLLQRTSSLVWLSGNLYAASAKVTCTFSRLACLIGKSECTKNYGKLIAGHPKIRKEKPGMHIHSFALFASLQYVLWVETPLMLDHCRFPLV